MLIEVRGDKSHTSQSFSLVFIVTCVKADAHSTRLGVSSWEIPRPLRSCAVGEPLHECPAADNAHMQTEIAAASCHGRSAQWKFCLTLKCMRTHFLPPP